MKYLKTTIGKTDYQLLDLDQKEVEKRIIDDMEDGVDVYYDRRWEVTDYLTTWLDNNRGVYADKRVLVLGAGVGAETLVLGRLSAMIHLNDLSPTALELCAEQLEYNGIENYEILLGRYEQLDLPEVDIVVASFLVYNRETFDAMKDFVSENNCQFILMNENLKEFKSLLAEFPHEVLFEQEGATCVLLGKISS